MKNGLASSVLGLLVVACGGSDGAAIVETPSEAPDGGPVVVVPPDAPPIEGGCDVSKLPTDNACVLHESVGVFVSSSRGADTNDGSRQRPFATLAKGIEAATATHRRVYACSESYAEQGLTLANGTALFGNLTCAGTWGVTTLHAVMNATTSPAARATDVTDETRIEGMDLVAPNGVAGESSVGVLATRSPGLHFVHGRIVAQRGGDGAAGANGIQLVQDAAFDGAAPHAKGSCTRSTNPVGLPVFSCPTQARAPGGVGVCRGEGIEVTTGPGGEGGRSTAHELIGSEYVRAKQICTNLPSGNQCDYFTSERGFPAAATSMTNRGANVTYDEHSSSVVGHDFAPGLDGAPGGVGHDGANASAALQLTATGFVPQDGTPGTDGQVGQGGGGGFAFPAVSTHTPADTLYAVGEGGPGGGAGGCPGLAGGGGKGGGASIGLLAVASPVRLDATDVASASGGLGGSGNFGSAPTAGGAWGSADTVRGAKGGGAGGAAGWSGHGASGPSFAIAWNGTLPTLSPDSTAAAAAPREGHPAVTADGRTIPAAAPGIAENVHGF